MSSEIETCTEAIEAGTIRKIRARSNAITLQSRERVLIAVIVPRSIPRRWSEILAVHSDSIFCIVFRALDHLVGERPSPK